MTDLSEEARRILQRAKAAQPNASVAARARVRAAVAATLAGEARGRAGHADAQVKPRWSPLRWQSSYGKWLALAGLGTLAGTALQWSRTSPQPTAAATVETSPQLAADSSAEALNARADLAAVHDSDPPAQPEQDEDSPARDSRAATHNPTPQDLRAELLLLRRAHAALDAGEPRTALVALDAHHKRFEHGQLSQERKGLSLIARCALGKEVARDAVSYLQAEPDSVLRARVQQACKIGLP